MATDYKISELASATSLDGTEQLVMVKSGENKKVTPNILRDFVTVTVNDISAEDGNIQLYVLVPEAVMQLAESGTSSADCITAFGGETALADWVAEVGGGKEVRIKVGSTTIPSTNVSFYEGDDGSVDIDIDYSTDESIHSLDIDITALGSVSVLHKTTTRKQVINIPYAVMALATSASGSDIVTAFGGESAMTNIIKAIQNGAMAQLELVSGYTTIYIPFNVISYEENSDDILNLSATFLDQTTIKSILIDDTLTDSAVLSTETTTDSSVSTSSSVITNLDSISNVNGMFSTTSSTTGTFPSEIDTDAKKKGSLVRVSNSEATDTEGFDIWMSTDTSMSNYVYYRRYSGTGVVTSWFRLLDNETPDVMHANTTPLTTTSTHLKSGTYAIDADTTIEGVSAGYGSMLVQMENYTNNTGVRTLTMITGDDAGKTFVSTVLTGTYGAFVGAVTLAQYNALVARVEALE